MEQARKRVGERNHWQAVPVLPLEIWHVVLLSLAMIGAALM